MRKTGVISVVVAGLMVMAACSSGGAARDDAGAITEEAQITLGELQVGDCLNTTALATNNPGIYNAVPCAEAHRSEVYYITQLPDSEYPGPSGFMEHVDQECPSAFEAYVGTSLDNSELLSSYFSPSEERWEEGQRELVCFVYFGSDSRTGSVEGSGA